MLNTVQDTALGVAYWGLKLVLLTFISTSASVFHL